MWIKESDINKIDTDTLFSVTVNCKYIVDVKVNKILLYENNIKNFILFIGDSRSMCRYIGGNHHRAGLPGAMRAWYFGHAGGHRVARNGRWWVVTSARTQRTVAPHLTLPARLCTPSTYVRFAIHAYPSFSSS